jgi:hypothetical protein
MEKGSTLNLVKASPAKVAKRAMILEPNGRR